MFLGEDFEGLEDFGVSVSSRRQSGLRRALPDQGACQGGSAELLFNSAALVPESPCKSRCLQEQGCTTYFNRQGGHSLSVSPKIVTVTARATRTMMAILAPRLMFCSTCCTSANAIWMGTVARSGTMLNESASMT